MSRHCWYVSGEAGILVHTTIMGVPGLWQVSHCSNLISSILTTPDPQTCCRSPKFYSDCNNRRIWSSETKQQHTFYWIGCQVRGLLTSLSQGAQIYASLLLNRAQWAAYHQPGNGLNSQAGENLPLKILFWQICRLLALPVTPIYVFDGCERPTLKRGRSVSVTPHALTHAFQELLRSAGFHFYTVCTPSSTVILNLMHWIGTWRGWGWVSAAECPQQDWCCHDRWCWRPCFWCHTRNTNVRTCIIRVNIDTNICYRPSTAHNADKISIYAAPSVTLRSSQMILIAILSGGDYDMACFPCRLYIYTLLTYAITGGPAWLWH